MSHSPPEIPHALFLSVFLSKASFLPTYVNRLNKTIFHDVKIDVLVNGELCASAYVSGRYHSDAYKMTEQIIRFSGRRVHRLLEKPWVLVPSGQCADGRLRPEKKNIGLSGDAKHRWASVSRALVMEANRPVRKRNGGLSVLGDYLSSLAALEMPTEVEAMQTVGGPKIGIIDVVVTAGKGQKDGANTLRLMEPTPMRPEEPQNPSATIDLDNVKEGMVFERKSIHQGVFSTIQRVASQVVNLTNELTKAQDVAEAQCPSPTLDETFTSPIKKRRSLGSRADSEILAQGFTSGARGLRSQSGLANDAVSSENHTSPLSREGAQSNDLLVKKPHGSFNTQSRSTNPAPRKGNNEFQPDKSQNKAQSPLVNPSHHASQDTLGRAPDPKSANPNAPAQKTYKGRSPPSTPSAPSVPTARSATPRPRPERKPRWGWEIVVDNKLTVEEEMEAIATEAARAASKLLGQSSASSQASRPATSNPSGFNEQRSLLRETNNSKRRKLYMEAASDNNNEDDGSANEVIPGEKKSLIVKLKIPKLKSAPPPQPLISLTAESESDPDRSLSPIPVSPALLNALPHPSLKSSSSTIVPRTKTTPRKSPRPIFTNPFSSTPQPSARRDSSPACSPTSLSHTWSGTPPLSEDAVVTYAPGNVLRQVKSERSGWFVEESVVMGTRFLIGG